VNKILTWLFLGAVVLGIAGLAFATERSAAQQLPNGDRFDLTCNEVQAPDAENGVPGIVKCTLTVDLPDLDPAPPEWPDTISVNLTATYNDLDGSGGPSAGDQLKCVEWSLSTGGSGSTC
jgi:hypothetical protein